MNVKLPILFFLMIAQTFAQENHEILIEKTDEPAKKNPKFAMIADDYDDTPLVTAMPRTDDLGIWTRGGLLSTTGIVLTVFVSVIGFGLVCCICWPLLLPLIGALTCVSCSPCCLIC